MSEYKNGNYDIAYTDTDSIYSINKKLDNKYIHNKLDGMKLEQIFDKAVFLAPKVYGGIIKDSKQSIIKIKGFKNSNNVKFEELLSLLNKNSSLSLPHDKWYKNIEHSSIHIKDQLYTLKVTDNKRNLIL